MKLAVIFLLFLMFSFLGWLMEEVYAYIENGKISNRGFLIGPICPIYGVGALLIITLLEKYQNDILALFVMSTLLGAILEYLTSYIMEKIFKVRWWDYSNYKFNINGRICLSVSVIFGFLGIVTIYILKPFFESILSFFPEIVLIIIAICLGIVFITDIIISGNVISKINKVDLSGARDVTDEITNRVRKSLTKHSIFTRRLANAFPDFKVEWTGKLLKIKKQKNSIKK